MTGEPAQPLAHDVPMDGNAPRPWAMVLWLILLIGIPMTVAALEGGSLSPAATLIARDQRPPTPPPMVEPVELVALDADQARAFNAAIPFSSLPNPAARPFRFEGSALALARATDCLAAAVLYEAGNDPAGERAVAQVVLNRLRHPAFPKTVCGVVFQGSERTTGCQFTFTCDGALTRPPISALWDEARKIATKALAGHVFRKVGYATHYHTDWVVPYWSGTLDKITAVHSHLFFRWTGWWGTPPAFRRTVDSDERAVPLLARLSPAHADAAAEAVTELEPGGASALSKAPLRPFGPDMIGKRLGGARLIAIEGNGAATDTAPPSSAGFIVTFDRTMVPDDLPHLAETFCGGRVQCRILAWMEPAKTPGHFPVDPVLLNDMAFSYIHDAVTGLQRALWNCRLLPRAAPAECMRERAPLVSIPPPLADPATGKPPVTVIVPPAPRPSQRLPRERRQQDERGQSR